MATIKDVARAANVSAATVSYVLNQSAPVSEATRRRVLEAVERLGYQPHQQARNLQQQRTATLGLVLPGGGADAQGASASAIDLGAFLLQVASAATGRGYSLLVMPPTGRMVAHGLADGWIALDPGAPPPAQAPCVWAVPPPRGDPRPAVLCDGAAGAERGVASLAHMGRRRIALIMPPNGVPGAARWYLGYRRALRRAGLDFDPLLVVEPADGDGAAAWDALVAGETAFDAILAADGALACGLAQAARRHPSGSRRGPGREWTLVAGADGPAVAGADLSALRWPIEAWAALLIERLVASLEGRPEGDPQGTRPPRRTLMTPNLIIRHS